jgi:L-rhamnose-H+ transport protein
MSGILAGIGWHMVGAASGAAFYAPIGKVKKWPWEITWAVAGLFSWIIMPLSVSFLLLPHFGAFYQSITGHVLLVVALLGAMWGIGNVSYGLTMRYLGMSLGIGVAMGVTLMAGTLIPPLLHGQAAALFTSRSGLLTIAGVSVALLGVGIVSYAGHQKELLLRSETREFNLKLGILLAGMCGLFSSGMSFAIDAARPMETAALHLGLNPLYAAMPSYVVIMGGGALVNFSYCFFRLAFKKGSSVGSDLSQSRGMLLRNGSLAATGGIMWFLQYFFYAWGAGNIPQRLYYVNWMLHMSGYVLCGGLVGLALGEWAGVGSRPVRLLWVGMLVIILAANLVGLAM